MAKKASRKRVAAKAPDLGYTPPSEDVEKERENIGRDGEDLPAVSVETRPTVCPNCSSPRRKAFKDGIVRKTDFARIQFKAGIGRYDRIVIRRTRCLDCGQRMNVREFTMIPPGEKPESPA